MEENIINGVDVSKCEFLQEEEGEYTCYAEEGSTCAFVACSACTNCYYKQLARKTSEAEGLRHGQHTQNTVIKELQEQLQAEQKKVKELDTENRRLKQATITLAEGLNIRQTKLENYKQALEEIKEIAEDIKENDCYENSNAKAQKIIDLVSEVLND